MIDYHPLAAQLGCHSTVAVAMAMLDYHLLYRGPYQHVRLLRLTLLQMPVIASPAHSAHVTHPFDRQSALLLRPHSDRGVDAEAPFPAIVWRPSLNLSKALFKKSFSTTLSASAACNLLTSSRNCFSLRS